MPIYTYACACGKHEVRWLKIAQLGEPQFCGCEKQMERRIDAPMVRGDYEPYNCPITGKRIEGKRAHLENLARHGKRVLEPGETEEVRRGAARRQAEADKEIDQLVEKVAHEVDTHIT